MSEWKKCKLEDIADVRDGTHDSPKKKNKGKYLITSRHIKNGKINFSSAYKISIEDYEDVNRRSKVDKYDVLFSMIGTIGEMVLIDSEPDFAIKNIGLFKTGTNRDIAKWIYYYFKSHEAKAEINASLKGSTQQYITLGDLRKFPIKLPPLPEQKAITGVLSSLDDKIDLLHRQNKTLELMAETLFRQWFIEENSNKISIADLVDFNPARKLQKKALAPYLEMSNVSTSTFHPKDWYEREFTSGMKFINGDTILARITPCLENGKTSFITFLKNNQVGWGSTEYIVMRSKDSLHPFFTYVLAKNLEFRDFAEGCLEGSSGRQRVNVNHLINFKVSLPSNEVKTKFNLIMESIKNKLHYNYLQNITLRNLRDTLLPKLMSGEVRVNYD